MRRRVAITGVGVVCPLGRRIEEVWSRIVAGESSVAAGTFKNPATGTELTVPIARRPDGALDSPARDVAGLTDRFTHMALQAASAAIDDARLDFASIDKSRVGVSNGTCMGGISETEVGFDSIYLRGRPKVHPFTVIRTMYNAPSAFVAAALQVSGPVLAYSTTCSSSSVAIGEAARTIRHGYADTMIAGGSESLLTYSAINCWHSAQLLARVADVPSASCRPFSADREGTALGEGAAFVVLEAWETAKQRGATILGELAGYGCTADSGHVTQPSVNGQARPMLAALDDGGVQPSQIDYVQAHGTGTKANDASETAAIKLAFGAHAGSLAVSSSKPQLGHMVGAAGAMSFVIALQSIRSQIVPPTINLRKADAECDLDYVPSVGRARPGMSYAMCNAFGFGGTAVSLVLRAVE